MSKIEINAKDYVVYTKTNEQAFSHKVSHQMHHALNNALRQAKKDGFTEVVVNNVCGQRYLGTDLQTDNMTITLNGTPGNDLAFAMNGPTIIVNGNAQDGTGNTMNNGVVVIHGQAGDITGLSARGGQIYVRNDVGYRAGIHMKEYKEKKPVLVVGGNIQDFAGEYMAGGIFIVFGLTLKEDEQYAAHFIGTGMHGGVMYLRGDIDKNNLSNEVAVSEPDEKDMQIINIYVDNYVKYFDGNKQDIMSKPFTKLTPKSLRPYGGLYRD
ncbi:MAG: hypothetical protein FWF37_03600 [Chloroflexi bacterium]|nr:hypothetical protein [Chloroflexota bacterium]